MPTNPPTDGLVFWFRSSEGVTRDPSGRVSQWANLASGGLYPAEQADPAKQPGWLDGLFNGYPGIWFGGGQGLLLPFQT